MSIKHNVSLKLFLLLTLLCFPLFATKKNTLCLTMIVKNESKIIERCLSKVKDIVDCISICDTGSTDNTVEIIENFMKTHHIPGKVYHHPWKNFGYNRTLSAEAARNTLKELGFSLSESYLLLLDADMILKVDPSFDKSALKEDAYNLIQKTPCMSYYNVRLIRANKNWICVGPTHEYWTCLDLHQISKLSTLWINDRGDGGSKGDKIERDIRLLTQGLVEEPNNPRYYFYLAQSYKCLGNCEKAIELYKKRIEMGGWKEEVWHAKSMMGECYEQLGRWDQALICYLDAYQYNPQRAEPLQKIASHYRYGGQHELAYLFAKQGLAIPYPKDQILFISDPVYDYQFDEEISISGYYTAFKADGFNSANRLVLNRKTPYPVKAQTYQNFLFYVQNLAPYYIEPGKTELPPFPKGAPSPIFLQSIQFDLPPIREGMEERYNPLNPSIQKTQEGYTVICRTVNFSQTRGAHYASRDPLDPTIRTRNFLLEYDKDLRLLSQKEIVEDFSKKDEAVQGLEDCRLFKLKGSNWFLCTTYGMHPGHVGPFLCKLEDVSESASTIRVEKSIRLMGPEKKRCEKNWLPLVKDDQLYVLYNYDPFTVYKMNEEDGSWTVFSQYRPGSDLSRFRGSAAPIPFGEGYLMVIHEVVFGNGRTYLHRFVYLDKDLVVKKVSKPFTFLHQGIEYCCGMAADHAGEKCILTISFEDQKAFFLSIDVKTIQSMLEPIHE